MTDSRFLVDAVCLLEHLLPAGEATLTSASSMPCCQEQLGLEIEPSIAPLEILVIDSAERPSEN